jgi:hypothetical protein
MDELLASRERMNRASAEFLKLDLQTALTFVGIARQTRDQVRKRRNCMAARRAYDTVMRLVDKIQLSVEDRRAVSHGLKRLRTELETLGEVF